MAHNGMEINLWRDVKAHILGGGVGPSPNLTCGICRERQMIIPGLHARPAHFADEDCCVLPCGHIFGDECLAIWIGRCWHREGNNHVPVEPPSCPTCRFPLVFPTCGHYIAPFRLVLELENSYDPSVWGDRVALRDLVINMPLTMHETQTSAFFHPSARVGQHPYEITCGGCFKDNSDGPHTHERFTQTLTEWFAQRGVDITAAWQRPRDEVSALMELLQVTALGKPWSRMRNYLGYYI